MLGDIGTDKDQVKFYGYVDLSAMSTNSSRQFKTYAWTAIIIFACTAFYSFNAKNLPPDGKTIAGKRSASGTISIGDRTIPNPEKKIELLTPEDYAMLQSLPSICVNEIPGLKEEDKPGCPATDALAQANVQQHETWKPPISAAVAPQTPTQDQNASFTQSVPAPAEPNNWSALATDAKRLPAKAQTSPWAPQAQSSPWTPEVIKDPHVQGASYESTDRVAFNPHARATAKNRDMGNSAAASVPDGVDPHAAAFSRTSFPSAVECAKCHEQIFEEWASSSHAYASISPMFHVFEDRINRLAQGTIGYFCMRCHAPVATTMGLRRDQAIWDGPRVFREGVTCVACHRVKTPYGKVNGERHMIPGGPEAPVIGGSDGKGVHQAAHKYKDWFKTNVDPNSKKPGQLIHTRSIQFEELSESAYCISCHQVAVEPGIKLEVVWDQYRASPAYREGITCQECHMGSVPGVAAGYSFGPAAVVDGKVVNPERKHSNHLFYGPGYSIAHPGLFPHNAEADKWSFNDWLNFDWRAGWGTKEFEKAVAAYGNSYFPPPWNDADTRMDAREIVDKNLEKLEYKRDVRVQLLENGSKLDGPFFPKDKPKRVGERLNFHYCLTNINPGHNMPSGSLGAQPQIWMNVVLSGPDGQRLWETGYLDSNGDLCDNHSLDVLARKAPLDTQLLNLQTKFLVTNVKGTDREMYLPVPYEQDQIPFLRPAPQPVTVLNHPFGIRMEGHSLPPLGSRNVKYSVPAHLICQPGTYTLSVRLRSRAEPIYFMRFCKATPEMIRMMNEWIADFHEQTVVFEVH